MTDSKNIENLRREIDQLDDNLLALLNERASAAIKVGEEKPGQDANVVYRPEREAQILQRLQHANNGNVFLGYRYLALLDTRVTLES